MWIRSSHLLDQGFLIVGKCEGCQIHAFRLPLVGEDDCDIAAPGRSCGGRRVLAWVELYLSVRELRPQSFERRRGEPDVVLPVSRALSWRRNRIASGRSALGWAASGNHAYIGVPADHRDAPNLRRIQGQ